MTQPQKLDPLTFPLHGMRLIEASAGTGKTWTIAALYLRLVLGHGKEHGYTRPLLPPEILVVTFTEAATRELRERIRDRLSEAARCFRGLDQPDGFLQALIEQCEPERRLAQARLLQSAAEWMDEAAIYTIHGWCNRMLRQHAFDSGSLFDQELEAGDRELLREVARDYWRTFFYPLDAEQVAAVATLAPNPEGLLRTLDPLLKEADGHWLTAQGSVDVTQVAEPARVLQGWSAWAKQCRARENAARQVWRENRDTLEVWLREASAQGWLSAVSYQRASFEQRLAGLADWAEGAPCDNPKWLSGFAQSRLKLNKKYQDKVLLHPAFVALDALVEQLEAEPDIGIALKLHARQWLRQRYQREKLRRARLDYDDLLTNLDHALHKDGGERLAEVIRRQYPLAMIDEFQDTDPVQYRIFSRIYREADAGACGLLMIGDPKQAIYAFRGADIHTYLLARRHTAGRHYTLECNFRSTQALVDAVNRVFAYGEAHAGGAFLFNGDDPDGNPLPFRPVEAQDRRERLEVDGRLATAMTLWHWQPDSDDGNSNLQGYLAAMAEAAAAEIVELLNLAGAGRAGFRDADGGWLVLQPADMAILVRNRHEAAAIRQALSGRGLRSVYLSDRDSVYKSGEAVDMAYWLRACAEPEQSMLLRAALATPTLALGLAELDSLQSDELRWEAEVEHFKTLRHIWQGQGMLPMLRQLMSDFALPQRLLVAGNGERALTNLLHLAELLQAASVELDGEQALIRHLRERIASNDAASDDSLLRLESDAGLIKVVTLHKSKGLEYPLVFLPFVCSFREVAARQSQYYRYHDDDGGLQIDLGKSDEARQLADRERLQEDLRLLYVGLTRARHACWLGVAPLKVGNSSKCQLHKSALGYLLAGGETIDTDQLTQRLQDFRGDCAEIAVTAPPQSGQTVAPVAEAEVLVAARSGGGRSMERWWIASYTALKSLAEDSVDMPAADAPDTARQANLSDEADSGAGVSRPTVVGDWHGFPSGSQAGVFLHGLLEWAAKSGFGTVAADGELRERVIAPRCERRDWHHWIPAVDRWLLAWLNAPLPLAGGEVSFSALPRSAYQAELEFWFAAERVDLAKVDALIGRDTLSALPRPALSPGRLNGMLKGFIDLVLEHQGRYYLIDYKSNRLGSEGAAYSVEAMRDAVLAERYDLQYCLYLLALHRLLKSRLGAAYHYDSHIGGVLYLFLRGIDGPAGGVHFEKPPARLIEALDSLFAGEEVVDAA